MPQNYQLSQPSHYHINPSNYKETDAESAFVEKYVNIAEELRQNPELNGEEHKTNGILVRELKKFIPDFNIYTFGDVVGSTNKSKYGIIAKIEGGKPSCTEHKKALILTADMDALPNKTDIAINDASHNCGHNVNMAGLLAAAEKLAKNKDNLSGEIFIIFTPAEESGGGFGEMIDKGLFENDKFGLQDYNPEDLSIITMHNNPMYEKGTIASRVGAFLCGNNDFKIEITDNSDPKIDNNKEEFNNISLSIIGKGGHGGMPHEANTPILPMLNLVDVLKHNPKYKNIQINNLNTGTGAFNIIPTEAKISISVPKSIDLNSLKDFLRNFCKTSSCEVNFTDCDDNDGKLSQNSIQAAKSVLSNLYNLVSKKTPAKSTNILSPTYASSNADGKIVIHGTSRFFENEHAQALKDAISSTVSQAEYYGDGIRANVEFIQDSYPVTTNTEKFTKKLFDGLIKLKDTGVSYIKYVNTNADQIGGRDAFPFAFSKGKVKHSAYFFTGTKVNKNEVGLHNTSFVGKADIHIRTAVPAFLNMVETTLNANNQA